MAQNKFESTAHADLTSHCNVFCSEERGGIFPRNAGTVSIVVIIIIILLLLLLLLFPFVDVFEHIHVKQGSPSPSPHVARVTNFVEWRLNLVGPKKGIHGTLLAPMKWFIGF
jgi:hypothetical protein